MRDNEYCKNVMIDNLNILYNILDTANNFNEYGIKNYIDAAEKYILLDKNTLIILDKNYKKTYELIKSLKEIVEDSYYYLSGKPFIGE